MVYTSILQKAVTEVTSMTLKITTLFISYRYHLTLSPGVRECDEVIK